MLALLVLDSGSVGPADNSKNNPPLGRPAQMTTMIDFVCAPSIETDLYDSDTSQDNPTGNSERVPDAQFPQIVKQVGLKHHFMLNRLTNELSRQSFALIRIHR